MFFKSLAIAGLLSLGATAAFAETSITATLAKPVAAPPSSEVYVPPTQAPPG